MKTKKEILEWWKRREKEIDLTKWNDEDDFWAEIDQEAFDIQEKILSKGEKVIILNKKGWKIDTRLFFYRGECWRILY